MAKGLISLGDALRIMGLRHPGGSFIPFSCTLITCDLRKDAGGRRLKLEGVTLAGPAFGKKNTAKDPRHFLNGTRNVMIPGKSRPTTIHNILITEFNGERVYI